MTTLRKISLRFCDSEVKFNHRDTEAQRRTKNFVLIIALSLLALAIPVQAQTGISRKQARDLIRALAGSSLPSSAVRVYSVRSSDAGNAEARAELQLVFRLGMNEGRWELKEIRTGPNHWERLDVIARAASVELPAERCDQVSEVLGESPSELTKRRARCLVAALLGVNLSSDEVRIRDISVFGLSLGFESAAIVEAVVQADFRFARDGRRWQVVGVRSGLRDWASLSGMQAAMDHIKRSEAAEDLSTIARALEEMRRERGHFVVSDKESVLIDHLSPRYLIRVIRVDPWHRPYQYEGQHDRYSLRSLGPDGKANTADDIVVSGP